MTVWICRAKLWRGQSLILILLHYHQFGPNNWCTFSHSKSLKCWHYHWWCFSEISGQYWSQLCSCLFWWPWPRIKIMGKWESNNRLNVVDFFLPILNVGSLSACSCLLEDRFLPALRGKALWRLSNVCAEILDEGSSDEGGSGEESGSGDSSDDDDDDDEKGNMSIFFWLVWFLIFITCPFCANEWCLDGPSMANSNLQKLEWCLDDRSLLFSLSTWLILKSMRNRKWKHHFMTKVLCTEKMHMFGFFLE